MKGFVLGLLLGASLSAYAAGSAIPLYVCIGPPVPCTSLTELTSASVVHDTKNRPVVTLNGKVYTAPTFSYSIPNSVLIPDVVYADGFDK